jgi:hypothetical protein
MALVRLWSVPGVFPPQEFGPQDPFHPSVMHSQLICCESACLQLLKKVQINQNILLHLIFTLKKNSRLADVQMCTHKHLNTALG